MKKLVALLGTTLSLTTIWVAAYAAPTNTPSGSSIIKSQPSPANNIQPAIPQPNYIGTNVPVGTDSTSTAQPLAVTPQDNPPSFDYDPVVTLKDKHKKVQWKSDDRFDIARVNGLNSSYDCKEQISFEVTGWSSVMEVNETNGFKVMATLYELPANRVNRAKTTYNPDIQVWEVKFTASRDNTKEYKILVNLYCAKKNSPCADTFGVGTQLDKIIPVQMF